MLKRSRVILSLLVLGLFLLIFLDTWTQFSVKLGHWLLSSQVIPAVLKNLVQPGLTLLGLVLVLTLTLLFGRIYCSTLCPLGTLQDIILFLHKKLYRGKKSLYRYFKPLKGLRYGILVLSVIGFLTGNMFLILLLDPYSIAGRMITQLLRPLFVNSFNQLVQGFQTLNYYELLPLDAVNLSSPAFWFTIAWMCMILWFSFRKNRLYCNSLCPVGVLLGLASILSVFRIKISRDTCTLCGDCLKVCKAGCIDLKKQQVDVTRCVGCQNCIVSCEESAIQYRNHYSGSHFPLPAMLSARQQVMRRNTLKGILLAPLVMMNGKNYAAGHSSSEYPRRTAITPPGSLGTAHFNQYCTACHLCVSQCPTQVLQPSYLEYGIEGMFQPMMNFPNKYCNYECRLCSLVCPTGAIKPLSVEQKKLVQIGKARFIEHLCIVITKGTHCGACSEHCPTKACDMIPYKGRLTLPQVNTLICIGCGACEHACPTQPKSIVVDENVIHLQAQLPKPKPLKPLPNKENRSNEDFPF